MTYKETKQYGAHSIINTTFYGHGHYIVNDREENDVTDNEFSLRKKLNSVLKD